MSDDRAPPDDLLHAAIREARDDAAPFALVAAGLACALALVSRHAGWELLGRTLWWIWLVLAGAYVALASGLLVGVGRAVGHDRRRPLVIGLLAAVLALTVAAVVILIATLVSHWGNAMTGRELLLTGATVWLANALAFGLAFWELDCGGPVARALSSAPRRPDFQFPQDENPELARPGWSPRVWDYLYVSLTNSIAFSPTDAMPLTRWAKALMAAESVLAAVTLVVVAARAVNIL
ncbi:MAG: DUF1345 domain-containing protein [Thermoleophilia bacterium]|nr:DUF1345 domain-containing protein [Gaiellaceae bacterium]MDW8338974.1 DUF1345 domain-containing protein [Thermoleophilia bacterium]